MERASDDFATTRVPLNRRSSLLSVSLIRIGAMTSLFQFLLGATLGHSMTFADALLATTLGSLLLEFVSLGLGIAGQREGMATSLLARWCGFGRVGASLVGLVIGVSLLGWFGVQNSIFAQAIVKLTGGAVGFVPASILTGAAVTLIVAYGFDGLSFTAKLAVPLFFAVVIWSTYKVLGAHDIPTLLTTVPGGPPLGIAAGATAVAGGYMIGALITPDMSRFCRSRRDVLWMTLSGIVVGEFLVNTLAILIANAMGTADVVTILTTTSGLVGLATVIFSTIKINDINLYSSTLGAISAVNTMIGRSLPRVPVTIAAGALGTLLSILGILDRFVGFLFFLGIVFPPIAGVMLLDYFVVKSGRDALNAARDADALPEGGLATGVPALASCAVGSVFGYFFTAGIPSLNSLFAAALAYGLISVFKSKMSVKEGVANEASR